MGDCCRQPDVTWVADALSFSPAEFVGLTRIRRGTTFRAVMPLGGWTSCLPPRRRVRQAPVVPVKDMPQVFTFALVGVVSEDDKLSKGKARKAFLKGKVTVNETVVHDPDMRVDGMARIVYKP